jgi:ABC-2 type transport system ATP-binding protein
MAASETVNQPIATRAESFAAPVIRLENLRHQYGDRVALNGVSFGVRPAEIFGLLGPNGSGKTTTFRILSTLMLPTSGQALYGLRGAALKKRVGEMLNRVGLADRANEKAETFSGGMQRRLELAKGLLHHPSVLLLDEPTTGLDPGARRDLWQYLQILRDEERVTVLITTHLMEEAERCDRLAIYAEGNVVALGTPTELKSEIGGDVILLESQRPESLAQGIELRFALHPTVMGNHVHLEIENGHRFVTEVVEAFPGEIEGVSVHKPSLEDVFIRRTGHRFWTEDQATLATDH